MKNITDNSVKHEHNNKLKGHHRSDNPINYYLQIDAIFNHLPDATFAINLKGKVIAWNQAIEDMTGVKADQIMGKDNYEYSIPFYGTRRPILIDLVFKSEEEVRKFQYREIKKREKELTAETSLKLKNREVNLWGKASPLYDADGELIGAIESIRDITEYKNIEKNLNENKILFETLLDSSHDFILLIDRDRNFVTVNDAFSKRFGFTKEEMISKNYKDILDPKTAEHRDKYMQKVFDTGKPLEFVDTRLGRCFENWVYPIKKNGVTEKIAIFASDITQKKKAENNVIESEEKYRTIFENSGIPMIFIEDDSVISMVNREFEKLSGYTKDEVEWKKSFTEFVANPAEKNKMLTYHHQRRIDEDKVPSSYEFQVKDKRGNILDLLVRMSMVPGTDKSLAALMDITERKKAEHALKKSMERFTQVVENAEEWVWEVDADGLYTYSSPNVENILGYKPDELVGKKHFYDFFKSEEKEDMIENVFKLFGERKSFHAFENKNIHENGEIIILETSGVPIFDENNHFKGYRGVDNNITLRKKAENELFASREQFKNIFDYAPIGIYQTTLEGKFLEANKALSDMLEYESVEEFKSIINKASIQKILYKTEDERFRWIEEVLKDDKWHNYELRLNTKIGNIITVDLSSRTVKNSQGEVQYLEGFVVDITESKETIDKLHRSEERFRALAESAVDGILTTDEHGKIILFNNSLLKIFGYQRGDILNQQVTLLIPERYQEKFQSNLIKFKSTGRHRLSGKTFLSIGQRKDGTEFPFEMSLSTWESEGERFNTSIIRDVTERKEAEDALKESEANFRSLVETTPEIIWEIDSGGVFTYISPQCQDIVGYPPEEIIGNSILSLKQTKHIREVHEIFLEDSSKTRQIEVELEHRNGNKLVLEVRSVRLTSGDGNSVGFRGVARDITDRKKAEEDLINSQNKLKLAMDTANLVAWEYDVGADLFHFDEQFYSLYGTTAEEVGGLMMSSEDYANRFVAPEEMELVGIEIAKALETDDPNYIGRVTHTILREDDGKKRTIMVNIGVVKDKNGRTIKTYGANQDITESVEAAEKLRKSEMKYHSLYSGMNEGMGIIKLLYNSEDEPVDYITTDVNPAYESIVGISREDIIGKKASEIYGNLTQNLDKYDEVAQGGDPINFETYYKDVDRYFSVSVTSPEKGMVATLFEDITERKKAEGEIKTSLRQKELLLQEIHHRVKNNLQIISSLLNLQESYVKDDESLGVLKESRNRVLSMAMIHEMLYDSTDLSTIEFSQYIENLAYDLFNSYGSHSMRCNLLLDIDDINLNIDTAVPCGLMVSELISNCLKYAFPEERKGNLSINFHKKNGYLELVIADDGVGLPPDVDMETTDSLGLRLVSSLVDQLDGTVELDRSHGTKFIINFKELIYRKRV